MVRYLIVFAAAATATASMMMNAGAQPPSAPRTISQTPEGKPIILGKLVVTASALPTEQ